jgi:hypothetical protein
MISEINRDDVPVLVLDLAESTLKQLGLCDVRNADAFRKFVETLPATQQTYLETVRKSMLQQYEDKRRRVLWLYSSYDKCCVLYQFSH